MELSEIAIKVAELSTIVGALVYSHRKMVSKQEAMEKVQSDTTKDIAVLQHVTAKSSEDHDKLILVEAAVNAAHKRLDDGVKKNG